jgi:hypothetical protein
MFKGWLMLIERFFRYLIYRIFFPDTLLRERYKAFKGLLQSDKEAHELMAGLQRMVYDKKIVDQAAFYALYERLLHATGNMVEQLLKIAPVSYSALPRYLEKIDLCIRGPLVGEPSHPQMVNKLMRYIDHLNLLDPYHPSFRPQGCHSIHDIIRFVHERAIFEMFFTGGKMGGRARGAKRLVSDIPFRLYVLDLGGGLCEGGGGLDEINISMVCSAPLLAFWEGLTHPDIRWSGPNHFDWRSFGDAVSAGGIVSRDSPAFASYALISADYMNINIKFGYHFVIIDTICGKDVGQNYIMFSFTGGGGDLQGKMLRVAFLADVLNNLDFYVDTKGDILNAKAEGLEQPAMEERLGILGRLLGVTRLMDMDIKNKATVEKLVADFMAGRYDFREPLKIYVLSSLRKQKSSPPSYHGEHMEIDFRFHGNDELIEIPFI